MKQLLWQTKTSFLNFRHKLDDCMFEVFSWHCKCFHECYSSIMLRSRYQNWKYHRFWKVEKGAGVFLPACLPTARSIPVQSQILWDQTENRQLAISSKQMNKLFWWLYFIHQKSLFICLFDLKPGGKRYETTWVAKRTTGNMLPSQSLKINRIICFKHTIKQKYCPPKNVLCPPNLKTWIQACVRQRMNGLSIRPTAWEWNATLKRSSRMRARRIYSGYQRQRVECAGG